MSNNHTDIKCPGCGSIIDFGQQACKYCKRIFEKPQVNEIPAVVDPVNINAKSKAIALLLSIFLGYFGVDRFRSYMG